ncbi:hypothetical protein LTR62_004030 [Meristemomyces frigidus]|uniref:Major facilitator superfamily (MFS) profile domain-containing protein n=1 Tax=Meristemomyces frigidus TaxID=1508187 RepID=A0AAN7TIC0_9PEZI|nr:hypothetical protein LTR62_004030 [Meristemomyces frigidus]
MQDDIESAHGHDLKQHDDDVVIQNDTYAIKREALGTDLPPNYWRSPGFIGTVAALCFGNISNYCSFVMPANSLALINATLGPSDQISWVALSYTLGLAVGFLLVGRLSDIFGRRWFFIGGNFLALICGILGAVATNINTVIGGNVLGGLGGAVQISFTVAIAELVPNKHRPLWIAGIFMSSVQFAAFGPVIAQALVIGTKPGWRVNYYMNIAVAATAVILFFFFYHPPNFQLLHENRSARQQFMRQDFLGLVLFIGGLILFIMGLSWGGIAYPWGSAHVIATIVVGFTLLVAFVLWEAYGHKGDPLLPLHLFKTRGYLAMVLTAMVGSPQQIAYLFGGSATHRGWLACTVGGSTLLGQVCGAALCQYIKKSRYILMSGTTLLLAFSAAMISIRPGDEAKGVALMFMACFSVGIVETCSLALAPLALPSEDIGAALGALGSIRSAGAAVATAIYVTILNNKLKAFIPKYVAPAALNAGLPQSSLTQLLTALAAGNLTTVPGIDANIEAAVGAADANAAADAFQYVWYAVVAFACVAVAASCLTVNYGQYLTDTVERKLHGKTVDGHAHGNHDERA